jgi:hypothetical protein
MGLFDHVRCEYPLPDPTQQEREFQTKDLDSLMHHYVITRDGRLIRKARPDDGWGPRVEHDMEWPIHGDIRIYDFDQEARQSIEYVVRFTHGRVEWVRPVTEVAALEPRAGRALASPLDEVITGRRLTAAEFSAHTPEKLELLDGRIPGDEDLLVLLLTSLGVRRAIELTGADPWRQALATMPERQAGY